MKLEKYIIQLLARHGVAKVPGLGTFRTEHRNAMLHNAILLPPGDIVVFSANNECRDNMLAETIMRDLRIKFEDAVTMVANSAKDVDVQSLCGWQSFLPQNFGMTNIPAPEIQHESIFQNLGKYAAAVAAALLLNISIPINKVPDTPVAEARLVPEFFANNDAPQPATDLIEEQEPMNYCVIVSSLDSREDAVNWIIAKSGCDSMEIIESDGHFRISASRFASYPEAAAFIKSQNLSAWVLHTK